MFLGNPREFIKAKYYQKDLSTLGEVIYCQDDLMILKLFKPMRFVKFIAMKIRFEDNALLYYNSRGDINTDTAIYGLVADHAKVTKNKFARTIEERYRFSVYRKAGKDEIPPPPKPNVWPELTQKRIYRIRYKLRERLRRIYRERKDALIAKGIPNWTNV